jgi:DNA polymerase I-like protein with 3'-5' exonuclease and polymerase domains
VREEPETDLLLDTRAILDRLEVIYDQEQTIAFDYETTGLKPQAEGHDIVYCGIAPVVGGGNPFAFPLYSGNEVRRALARILRNRRVRKICHNMKFELLWSKEVLGVWPQGMLWDTMLAAHILDNRPGVTGLKFQTYVNFGVVGYDAEIDPYLRSSDKNANSFNQIRGAPANKALRYCALDAYYTMQLYSKQQWKMERLCGNQTG